MLQKIKVILLLTFVCLIAENKGQSVYPISPQVISGEVGTEFIVDVAAKDVSNLFGVSFNMKFDSQIFEVVSVNKGDFLGSDVVFFPNTDNSQGILSVGMSRKSGQGNVNGKGKLVSVKLKVKASSSNKEVTFVISNIKANDDKGNSLTFSVLSCTSKLTQVGIENNGTITAFRLNQNYPNPFNPTTTISYELPKNGEVLIEVYNTLGEVVATLVNGRRSAGLHRVTFDAYNLPTGVYFYKINYNGNSLIKKMILMK